MYKVYLLRERYTRKRGNKSGSHRKNKIKYNTSNFGYWITQVIL